MVLNNFYKIKKDYKVGFGLTRKASERLVAYMGYMIVIVIFSDMENP